jgi:hypothetical protein
MIEVVWETVGYELLTVRGVSCDVGVRMDRCPLSPSLFLGTPNPPQSFTSKKTPICLSICDEDHANEDNFVRSESGRHLDFGSAI